MNAHMQHVVVVAFDYSKRCTKRYMTYLNTFFDTKVFVWELDNWGLDYTAFDACLEVVVSNCLVYVK